MTLLDLQNATLNVLGDSITQGAGASDYNHCYVKTLETMYGFREVRNYGIGGTRIARRTVPYDPVYDQDFCQRAPLMDPNTDAVLVFGGVNDFGHGDAPIGVMSDRTPYTFYGACHTLMHFLVTHNIGKPVAFVTPLRCLNEEGNPDEGRPPLIAFRNVLLEVAFYYSLPVLDLYATSGIRPDIPEIQERLLPDGLHPSNEGHAIIARRIGEFLRTL